LVANTLGQAILEPNDEILITELEHHSNYVPWHFLRKSKNIKIKFAEINEDGDIPIENIEKGKSYLKSNGFFKSKSNLFEDIQRFIHKR